MKKYLKDLELKDIIENLKKGFQIKNDVDNCKFFMVDNIICFLDFEGDKFINSGIPCSEDIWYFEIEEQFEIKQTGLYKLRNGKRAFVNCLNDITEATGVVENIFEDFIWNKDGTIKGNAYYKKEFDIISKCEE